MEQWSRRDVLKLGALAPAGVASLRWAQAAETERNLALNRACWASSAADFIRTGHMVTDGQPHTEWASAGDGRQWVYVDLGAPCEIRSIVLRWGKYFATAYELQVSSYEGPSAQTGYVENWTGVSSVEKGRGGVETISLPGTHARYVRLVCTQHTSPTGYQLSGLEVYGTGGMEALPIPLPPLAADGTLRLSGGWRLINQAYISEEAPAISTPGYDDSHWLIATVPGTVLTSYQNLGAVPDMFYGDHQLQVSDFFAHTSWWYRNELMVPAAYSGRRTWLHFDGIHYRAFVYVNGNFAGRIDGAFMRGRFDITEWVAAGKKNCIAVLILPVPKPDKVNVKGLSGYTWPEEYPSNEPTILPAASWDWLPTIRDRDIGIWNHAWLVATGDVTIENVFASTHFPKREDLTRADVTLRMELVNHGTQPRRGELHVRLGKIQFRHTVALAAQEKLELKLAPSAHPELSLHNPRLWWPNGYGEQNLHELTVELRLDGTLSDVNRSRVGIREFTYNQPTMLPAALQSLVNGAQEQVEVKNPLSVSCNGQRIFIRGVNWAIEEGMLRCDREGFETRLRMEQQMNFNLIRNWAGNQDKPEFFELCDELGLMVWEEFGIANLINPDDPGLWLASAHDRFLRRRNHACVVLWCSANETLPIDPILTAMPKLSGELDGTRLLLECSTQIPPTNGDGPYTAHPASYYFKTLARGFRPELGSPSVPCVESMRRMMPQEKLWPINDLWGMHDWWSGKGWDGNGICGPTELAAAAYGVSNGIEDFCRKAQMVSREAYKAIYESWNDRMWSDCTGLMIWMSNPAWPSLSWNTYDYYQEPTAAYYSCREACEPVHIQWNCATGSVKVVNSTLTDHKSLSATAEIYNMDGTLFTRKTVRADCPANQAVECMRVLAADGETAANLSDVHFLRLQLNDVRGTQISRNFYWRAKTEGQYKPLEAMKPVRLIAMPGEWKNGKLVVELANESTGVALMVRLKLIDLATGRLIAPVTYSENYLSLVPGERRPVEIRAYARHRVSRAAALMLEGWNVAPSELARIRV